MDVLYGDTDSVFVHFPEPAEVLAGSRKDRLLHAMAAGASAEAALNVHLNELLHTRDVKVEFEKVYFPFLSARKKTYAGNKFEPGDELAAGLDESLTGAGRLECKGIRTVRRDVPGFVRKMTAPLFHALFQLRDLDTFWDIVHTFAERVALCELPIEDYVITAELNNGYEAKAMTPQAAVTYAREWACRGAAFQEGDRVPIVFVEEVDNRRMQRPPWMDADIAARQALAGSGAPGAPAADASTAVGYDDVDEDSDEEESMTGGLSAGRAKRAFEYASVDDKKAKHARHPSEVTADPASNHLDVVHYIDALNTVLRQLMPDDEPARQELVAFALEARAFNRSKIAIADGHPFAKVAAAAPRPRKLSHRSPVTTARATLRTLTAFTSSASAASQGTEPGGMTGATCSISTAPKEKAAAARKLPSKTKPTTVQSTLKLGQPRPF